MSPADGTVSFEPLRLEPCPAARGQEVVELLEHVYAEYGQVVELDTLDADLNDLAGAYAEPHVFRILLDGDRLVGTVAVKHVGDEEAELKRVFLDAAYRSRGIGRKLCLWAFGWARARGYRTMRIWSDVLFEPAHALYRRLGARDTGDTRRLGGRNDVLERYFVKELSP